MMFADFLMIHKKNFFTSKLFSAKVYPTVAIIIIQTSLLHVMKNRVGTHFTQKVSCIQK